MPSDVGELPPLMLEQGEIPTYVGIPYQTCPEWSVCKARRRPSFLAHRPKLATTIHVPPAQLTATFVGVPSDKILFAAGALQAPNKAH